MICGLTHASCLHVCSLLLLLLLLCACTRFRLVTDYAEQHVALVRPHYMPFNFFLGTRKARKLISRFVIAPHLVCNARLWLLSSLRRATTRLASKTCTWTLRRFERVNALLTPRSDA